MGTDTELPDAQSTHVWPCYAIHIYLSVKWPVLGIKPVLHNLVLNRANSILSFYMSLGIIAWNSSSKYTATVTLSPC